MHNEIVTNVVRLVDSNKARLAFLAPAILAVGVAATNWVVTGNLDLTEVRIAAGGAIAGAAAGVAAYLGNAGKAVVEVHPNDVAGDAEPIPEPPRDGQAADFAD